MRFIKKLLQKHKAPQEPKIENITFSQVLDWFDKKTKNDSENTQKTIQKQLDSITKAEVELQKKLDNLENSKLKNPNIPPKAKHILEGSIEHYNTKTREFSTRTALPPLEFDAIEEFITNFEERLADYTQSTNKSKQVINEFFSHELRDTNIEIKKIVDATAQIKETIEKSSHKTRQQIKLLHDELNKRRELIGGQDDQSHALQEQVSELESDKRAALGRVQRLKHSNTYQELEETYKKRDKLAEDEKRAKNHIRENFTAIDKSLRKYAHQSVHKELINNYLEDSIGALVSDLHLRIIQVFKDFKKAIERRELDFKDDKIKNKTLHAIDYLDTAVLSRMLTELNNSQRQLLALERDINSHKVLQELKEEEYKIEHYNTKINKLKDQIEDLQVKKKRFDVSEIIKKLQELIEENTNIKTIIEEDDKQTRNIHKTTKRKKS
ncbi:hypothetical protein GOV04_04885 [Candidatus Woesearchaeota archaeon]|nr:hypothetical protein [Candidatus Woesearchaeota archaeon]